MAAVQDIQLIPLRERDHLPAQAAPPKGKFLGARRIAFCAVVIAPTVLAACYEFFLAAPRYVSEAEFVIRAPGAAAMGQISALVQTTGAIRSTEDGYIVDEYIKSRDALKKLADEDGFRALAARAGADVLWRYPALFSAANDENLYKRYKSLVSVSYDAGTGVASLRAQAFRADDARSLAEAVLRHSEALINSMNERAETDAISVALRETDLAKQRAYEAADAMTAFRNRERVIDPTLVSESVLTTMTGLAASSAQTNAAILEMQKLSPLNPQIRTLKAKVASIEAQIAAERARLAGGDASLAPQIAAYDRLLLDQQFAERMFASALASLETARLDAQRQRAFLERIAQPNLPDRAAYPYRALTIGAVFLIACMVYRIARLLVKDTLEHAAG